MSVDDCLQRFRDNLLKVNGYIAIAYESNADGTERCSNDEKEFIVSSAFLKMFIGWEEYLESVFIKFLTGEPTITGEVIPRYATPIDTAHAHKIIIGTQKYVDWANHEIVMRLSKLFFEDGEPISTSIASIARDISDLRVIRNAAAHISTTTQHKLDAVASRKFGSTIANIGVAEFVTSVSPDDPAKTILQTYQLILDITAENIANNNT